LAFPRFCVSDLRRGKRMVLSFLAAWLAATSGTTCFGFGSAEGTDPEKASKEERKAASTPAPEYQNVRYLERWNSPSESASAAWHQRIKYLPLNGAGSVYLSLGGQLRLRSESWWSFGFREGIDDTFGLSRLRLHGDLYLGPHVRFFLEGKSSLAADRDLPGGLRTLDVDTIDLQNGFLELRDSDESMGIKVGRQELQYGKQRLVSPLDWANTRRTFDVARASVRPAGWNIDGFWGRVVQVRKYEFNTSMPGEGDFYGFYATKNFAPKSLQLDLYWLGLNRRSAVFGSLTAKEERQTFGARLGGNWLPSGDFDLESAFQTGDYGNRRILAAMFTAQAGYTWNRAAWSPRTYINFDYASGDGDPADGRLGTFNQLFPLGHAYLGFIDFVGRQNIEDLSLGVTGAPARRLRFSADWHNFWRAERNDALYNAGGSVVRRAGEGLSRSVGRELDLTTRYSFNRHLTTELGYCHFFPGPFLTVLGPDQPIDFVYLQVVSTF